MNCSQIASTLHISESNAVLIPYFIPLIVWHFRCNVHLCKCNDFIRTAFMTRSNDGGGDDGDAGGVYCDSDVATMDDVNIDVNDGGAIAA